MTSNLVPGEKFALFRVLGWDIVFRNVYLAQKVELVEYGPLFDDFSGLNIGMGDPHDVYGLAAWGAIDAVSCMRAEKCPSQGCSVALFGISQNAKMIEMHLSIREAG